MLLESLKKQANIDTIVAAVLATCVILLAANSVVSRDWSNAISAIPLAMLCASLMVSVALVKSRGA